MVFHDVAMYTIYVYHYTTPVASAYQNVVPAVDDQTEWGEEWVIMYGVKRRCWLRNVVKKIIIGISRITRNTNRYPFVV
jgi:hypothetical protein